MTSTQSLFTGEGLDTRTLDMLVAAIEKNNLPGFDYLEFKRAIITLTGMEMPLETAYKSAFATASQVGVTKEKLVETAGYYRNLLDKERAQFDTALQNQVTAKVTAREEEAVRLRDQIERHKAEIARLQDEVADYLRRIEQAESQAKSESEKIDKAREGFDRTHAAALLQIDADIEQIHKLL